MFTETAIDQFILKIRLQAIIEGIDEQAALSYIAARLRLATGEITQDEYQGLVDEIAYTFAISPNSNTEQLLKIRHWMEQQLYSLQIAE